MRTLPVWTLIALTIATSTSAYAQVDRTPPADDEIKLTFGQADRAVQKFSVLLDEEQSGLGRSVTEQIADDRQHVSALASGVKLLQANPQNFNGPAGFTFLELLNFIDRGALQCGMAASSQSSGYM